MTSPFPRQWRHRQGVRRYRRMPFHHHPGDGLLGAIVRDVVSGQHRSERVPSDPSGPVFPAISGLGTLATSVQMCEDRTNEQAHSLATMGLDSLGSPVFQTDGPTLSHELHSKDNFHG